MNTDDIGQRIRDAVAAANERPNTGDTFVIQWTDGIEQAHVEFSPYNSGEMEASLNGLMEYVADYKAKKLAGE